MKTNDVEKNARSVAVRDYNFYNAHGKVTAYFLGNKIDESELEEACATLTEYSLNSGDRLALIFFIVAYNDFLNINKSPPMPMLKGLGEILDKYRQNNITMDNAFNLSRKEKGNPGLSLDGRTWAITNASLVCYWISQGETLEIAIEKTAAFRKKDSESSIKRHYLKYRKLFKKDHLLRLDEPDKV